MVQMLRNLTSFAGRVASVPMNRFVGSKRAGSKIEPIPKFSAFALESDKRRVETELSSKCTQTLCERSRRRTSQTHLNQRASEAAPSQQAKAHIEGPSSPKGHSILLQI